MCGRYTAGDPDSVAARYGFVDFHETKLEPRFNVAASQAVPVVVGGPDGPALRLMRWGFQPSWMKEPRRPPRINARSESLLEKPLFRDALARGRCIIPADGFYEWVAVPGQRAKRPMHFRLRGGEPFGFAGLYTVAPDGQETCAIVTTAANELIAPLHHRMPAILEVADEPLWLDPSATDPRTVLPCLRPLPAERMEAFPVGPLVSSVRNDGPELIRPSGTEEPATPVHETAYQPGLFGDLI
jgi:putative SOS response-associated peptidase YedK